MFILDTNILLRFILQDNIEQAIAARKQMLQHPFTIPIEVIAEVVYVLGKVYKIDRRAVVDHIKNIIYFKNAVIPNKRIVKLALNIYARKKFDFIDCVLVGYSKYKKYEIISFDKDLNKYVKSLTNYTANN
ncbi:MAG: PIN domain-containing protein [Planctomycetaceae bacterium]|jgi:predicted nucleic-acid-binding protein|nr:PIN domain-containing protein [Planctomycetaceae bacterium]